MEQNKDGVSQDIPKPIQQAMTLLQVDMHKAYELASIFGYTGSTSAIPTRLQDGSMAPATQADAIEKIEGLATSVVSLEKEKSDLDAKVVELEESNKTITAEKDAIKAELEAIEQVKIDAQKVELETLSTELKKVDEKDVFLESIKDLGVDKQITLVKTYLSKFGEKKDDPTDIKLKRDDTGATGKVVEAASEELFGLTIDELVTKMTGLEVK
jgi:regulator of replication initiation timing